MLYNHNRVLVDQYRKGDESLCPECRGELIAKRGDIKIWHWAHKSNSEGCSSIETDWHLLWKASHLSYSGWEIEFPVKIDGKKFRLDAYNPQTKAVREFVHSLSSFYVAKHEALVGSGYDVLWIWHGDEFARKYTGVIHTSENYYLNHKFLKPGPAITFMQIGGYLHYRNQMWRGWMRGMSDTGAPFFWWFPISSPQTAKMCSGFVELERRYRETKRILPETSEHVSEVSGYDGDSGIQREAEQVEGEFDDVRRAV